MNGFKRCFILILVLFMGFHFTACTSSEDDTSVLEDELENLDSEEGELSDELDGDDDDLADIEDDELRDELDEDDESDEFGDEEFAENDDEEDGDDADFDEFDEFDDEDGQALAKELGQEQGYPQGNGQPSFPEEVVAQQNNPPPPMSPPPPPQPQQDPFITSETKDLGMMEDMTETSVPQDDLGKADPLIPEEEVNSQNQNWVPVVKVKQDAFFRNNRLMNTVYLARPDESLGQISEKIFGSDKSNTLLEDNPHLAKGVDPGDKVYYNSPNRGDDRSALKIYYDDIGLRSQKYVTNRGDNMRRLGSKLLGFAEGWKEIWAINPAIDSKTVLPVGTEVRYWTGEEQPIEAPALTEEIPADEAPPGDQVAKATMTEEMPPVEPVEPPPEAVTAELPPEPPLPEATISEEEAMDPELLADADIEPLPEDDLSDIPAEEATPATVSSADQSQGLITTAVIALLVFAGVGLVAIQIKKRKDQTAVTPPSLEYTQV